MVEVAQHVLQRGDRVFCITDGVIDAHRPGGEDFGEQRLIAFLGENLPECIDAAETVRRLSHTVLDHNGTLSDDTTVFLLDWH